jgi:hypothetical protein
MLTVVSDTTSNDAGSQTSDRSGAANKAEHQLTQAYDKNVKQTSRSKNDTKFWLKRLFKPISGRGTKSPSWSVKIQFRGKRTTFRLLTSNKEAAARRALAIYQDVVDRGLDAVIAERRRGDVKRDSFYITIGDWITAASKVFAGAPITFAGYARS